MAKPEKHTYFVLRDGTQFGLAETVQLTEGQALAFVRAGELTRYDGGQKPKRTTLRSKAGGKGTGAGKDLKGVVKQLEAELAEARKGGADPQALAGAIARAEKAEEALKAAQDEKAAAVAALQQAQEELVAKAAEIQTLNDRAVDAEELAEEAATEAESLGRVIAILETSQPDLVAQAHETVVAEYAAAAQQG